jgi:hypothetical protein
VGLLIIVLGARFSGGWRTHSQRIMIGLSTASIAQIGFQAAWESIIHNVRANPGMIHSMADQQRLIGLGDKMTNANEMIMILCVVWWIVMLWMDEPGKAAPVVVVQTAEVPELSEATEIPAHEDVEPIE